VQLLFWEGLEEGSGSKALLQLLDEKGQVDSSPRVRAAQLLRRLRLHADW